MNRSFRAILSALLALTLLVLPRAQGAQEHYEDPELARAVTMGVGAFRRDDPQVTFAQFYEMLDRVVALSAPDSLEAWRAVTPEARLSSEPLDRFNGMFALFLAAESMGGEYMSLTTDWWILHQTIGEPWDGCQLHPLFGGLGQAETSLDGQHWQRDASAYFYAMGRASLYSGQLLFDYDPVSNSMRPDGPFLYTEALLAALRLYDSSSANFPVAQRWPSPADLELLERAGSRRQEILDSESMALDSVTGTTYYISNGGDDANDGKSPEHAWATLGRHNDGRWELQPGDAVLLERGGLWRGMLRCAKGVTYSAYGEGPKPRLYGSPEDGAAPGKWSLWYEQGDKKIWKFYRDISDCGGIVFNDGEGYASRVFSFWNGTQAMCTDELDRPFDIVQGLTRDLQFYSTFDMAAHQDEIGSDGNYWVHNVDSRGPLYLRCDEGNPGKLFRSIEFQACVVTDEQYPALGYTGIVTCGGDNVIDNLCVMYRSTMGLDRSGSNNNTFQNCEVGWIGGGSHILSYATSWGGYVPTSGECIRMEGVHNTTKNCYVHDGFDGGITVEFDSIFLLDPYCSDMTIQDNVIERCMSGILIGDHNDDRNDPVKRFGDMHILGNYILDSGYGWSCADGYDYTWGSEEYNGNAITLWDGPSYNDGIEIKDNILYRARFALVHMGTDAANRPNFSGNTYVQDNNGVIAYMLDEDQSVQARYTALDDAKTVDICKNGLGDRTAVVLPLSWKPDVAFPAPSQALLWTGAAAELQPPVVTVQGRAVQAEPDYAYRSDAGGSWHDGLPKAPGIYQVRARMPGGVDGDYAEDFLDLTVACFLRSGGEVRASFPLGTAQSGRVLAALYDEDTGRLLTVAPLSADGSGAVHGLSLPAPAGGPLRAKVFVLDALSTLRPLAEAGGYPVVDLPA